VKPNLSSTTTGLADCIENAIKHRFKVFFETEDPILAAVV